jgi:hypothetical protein
MSKKIFYPLFLFYAIAIVYLAYSSPISPHEAKVFYTDTTIVNMLMHAGRTLLTAPVFGSFLGIRIFFILIGLLTIPLYCYMTGIYLKRENDRYMATAIYMLLPGIITATSLANISVLVLPVVLLFIIAYQQKWIYGEAVLMLLLFVIHDASVIFFVSVFIYALVRKEIPLMLLSGFFLVLSFVTLHGVEIGGRPSGHFADLFGLYAALFSPLLFIYFFYTMYRIFLREEKNILWYISFIALLSSLILSVRQRVNVTDFAPYVVISVVLMLDTFYKSFRIRLPRYRGWYRTGFTIVILVLVASALTIFFHKAFFHIMKDPKKHFAAKLYEPYWLAQRLKREQVGCYDSQDSRVAIQLRFYGIESCRN